MSRRRAPRKIFALFLACTTFLALAASGCIFSPKEKDNGGGGGQTGPAKSQDELIGQLKDAYQRKNYDLFATLFSTAGDSAAYFFYLNQPIDGVSFWDLTEELRIHRRMFKPEDTPPGEEPLPQDLWLLSVDINLTRSSPNWTERTDLYRSESNPDGLNPARWRVTDAIYQTYVFFETQGETDYQVNGRANYIVVEDLTKAVGQERKFLIYRWEDLGAGKPTAEPVTPGVPAI